MGYCGDGVMYMTEAEKREEFIDNQRFLALCEQELAKNRDYVLRLRRKARIARRLSYVLCGAAIVLGLAGRLLN